jgi:DNA polymerase elongation subunit (family B)
MQQLFLVDAKDFVVDGSPLVRLFCRRVDGTSVDISVKGVPCSLFVGFSPPLDAKLKASLAWVLSQRPQCRAFGCETHGGAGQFGISREPCSDELNLEGDAIISWGESEPLRPFDVFREQARRFLKVELARPWDISRAANWLLKNVRCDPFNMGVFDKLSCGYEYFMRETGISGFEWFHAPVGVSVVDWRQVKRMAEQPTEAPPLRKFTFDIEVLGVRYQNEGTVNAEYPVCVISAESRGKMVSFVLNADQPLTGLKLEEEDEAGKSDPWEDELLGELELATRRAQALKKETKLDAERLAFLDANRARRQQRTFDSERDLLLEFSEFLKAEEPDFVVGFNHRHYDIPYLLRRARNLNIKGFGAWSRGGHEVLTKTFVRENKGMKREMTQVDMPGIVVMDLMLIAEDSLKLDSYSLNSVASELGLGSKGDVKYDQIWPYFYGSAETRAALVLYCERDVFLTSQVEVKFDQIEKCQAKAKVQRVLGRDTTDRGLSYTLTQFLRSRILGKFLLPVRPSEKRFVEVKDEDGEPAGEIEEKVFCLSLAQESIPGFAEVHRLVVEEKQKYEGAYVFEPKPGLREDAIVTFDFSSLYPNTAITNNICPSTLFNGGPLSKKPDGSTIYRFHFKSAHERKGVLPEAWEYLVAVRNKVRKEQKGFDKESTRWRQLEALQGEFKVVANALYGQFGAKTSPISCFPVASSITAIGRTYILRVEQAIQAAFPIKVDYGDTDSLFVRLIGVRNASPAFKLGREIHTFINDKSSGLLTGSMSMEMENVSMPTLIVSKKKNVKVIIDEQGAIVKVKSTGMDNRTLNLFVAKTIRCILSMKLERGCSQSEIVEYLRRRGARLMGGMAHLADLMFAKKLTKPPSEYTSLLPHVVAAKQLQVIGTEVKPGDRIPFFFAYVAVPKEDAKKKSPFAVCKAIFLSEGHHPHLDMNAESMAMSVKATCFHFFEGAQENIHDIILNQRKIIYALKPMPKTSVGEIEKWLASGEKQGASKKRERAPDAVTKRLKQVGLFDMQVAQAAPKEKKKAKEEQFTQTGLFGMPVVVQNKKRVK